MRGDINKLSGFEEDRYIIINTDGYSPFQYRPEPSSVPTFFKADYDISNTSQVTQLQSSKIQPSFFSCNEKTKKIQSNAYNFEKDKNAQNTGGFFELNRSKSKTNRHTSTPDHFFNREFGDGPPPSQVIYKSHLEISGRRILR